MILYLFYLLTLSKDRKFALLLDALCFLDVWLGIDDLRHQCQ